MTNPLIKALGPLVQRVRTDVSAVKRNGKQSWTNEPINDERLAHHLNGGPARGVCPIKAGESVTLVALLDLDSHKGEVTWDQMTEAAGHVVDALQRRHLAVVPYRSSGGHGIHLYVLWDAPQDAYSVRALLAEALAEAGYANGTGGVRARQIEIFPKQNSVKADGFGNQFILPLAGRSVPLDPLDFGPMDKDPALILWPSSPPVVARDRPAAPVRSAAPVDGSRAERALMAIPNDIDNRDEWFNLMCAFKEAGGDKEAARSWTAQHAGADDSKFDGPWDSIDVGKPDGVPADYLFIVAQRHGFGEHIADDFEVVLPEPGEPPAVHFDREKGGAIKPTVGNTVLALRRPDLCGQRIAYDSFRDEMTVAAPGTDGWRSMTDADAVRMRMTLERMRFKSAPKELVRDAAVLVAAENVHDSAQLWLSLLRWDGRPRVENFLRDYMGCEDSPYTRAVGRYMWSALAGRVIEPGVKADMAPIYEGEQGLRKSSAIEALSPAPEFFAEIDLGDKEEDTVRKLRGVLVGEIAELSGLHTRALEGIKKFIVRRHEKWVPKYKEFPTTFARRLLFIGTTNRTDILADETGNRRWLPVHITRADVETIVRDREQLWAEGAALFAAEGVCWRDAERLAPAEHGAYTLSDMWEKAIRDWLDGTDDFDGVPQPKWGETFHTSRVAGEALRISTESQDRAASNRIGAILRMFGFVSTAQRVPEGGFLRVWVNEVERAKKYGSACHSDTSVTLVASQKIVNDFNDLA